MAKASTQVAKREEGGRPAYLEKYKNYQSQDNLDSSDLIVPRIKLLQGLSPEVKELNNAKAGIFWHNTMDAPLGQDLKFIPCIVKKQFILFAPREDGRSVLARAADGVHWDNPNGEWDVKQKGVKGTVNWKTAKTVKESGLDQFGSYNPDDPESKPAATLVYEYLCYLPDHPELSPVLISLTRSQVKRAKDLNTKIKMRGIPPYAQQYRAVVVEDSNGTDEYYNYKFLPDGNPEEEIADHCEQLAQSFTNYRAANEEEYADDERGTNENTNVKARGGEAAKNKKF